MFGYEYPNLGGFSLIGETVLLGEFSAYPLDRYYDDFEITQWTWRKDKNNKEIYEGDIVKSERFQYDDDTDKAEYVDKISVIEYKGHGFWVKDEYFGYEGEGLWDWDDLEVIGNVFENPELLKI